MFIGVGGSADSLRFKIPPTWSSDNVWPNDPYNPEVIKDGYGWYNSILRLDTSGSRIPAKNNMPWDQVMKGEHFTIYYLTKEKKLEEAQTFLSDMESLRSSLLDAYGQVMDGGICEPTGHLSPECLEEYNQMKFPLWEKPITMFLGPMGTRSDQKNAGAFVSRIFCSAGTKAWGLLAPTLSSSLSGKFKTELGKFGLCTALTSRLEKLPDKFSQLKSGLPTTILSVKSSLKDGRFVPLEKLATDPLTYFYKEFTMEILSETTALYHYLLATYPGNRVFSFAQCGNFECLNINDWATLERNFITWVNNQEI